MCRRQVQIGRRCLSWVVKYKCVAQGTIMPTDDIVGTVRGDIWEATSLVEFGISVNTKGIISETHISTVVELTGRKRWRAISEEVPHVCCLVRGQSTSHQLRSQLKTDWVDDSEAYGNILEKPPPEKMTCSHAPSGSLTVELGFTCVAPTATTKGQVA
jgi:hypothetical protein